LHSNLTRLQKQAEKAKIFSEKRKQLMQFDLAILVKDLQFFQAKLEDVTNQVKNAKNELEVFEPDIEQATQSLTFAKQKTDIADKNIDELNRQLTDLIEKINRVELKKNSLLNKLENDLSSENAEKKASAYKELIASTKFELNDAKSRIEKLNSEISTYNEMLHELNTKKANLSEQSNKQSIALAESRMQIKNLKEAIANKNNLDIGVRTIIENQQALNGICGLVKNFFTVDEEYEKAILTALGRANQNIIVESDNDAKNAINFLKRNHSGKATFLPLNTIKPKSVRPEHLEVLNNFDGFVGIGNNLIHCDQKYQVVFDALLGNVILANSLDDAIALSNYTYKTYRTISLDGDVIAAGGAITGGFNRLNPSMSVNLEKKLNEYQQKYDQLTDELLADKINLDKLIANSNEIASKLSEKKILLMRYQDAYKNSENQLYKYEMEYEQLINKNDLIDHRDQ